MHVESHLTHSYFRLRANPISQIIHLEVVPSVNSHFKQFALQVVLPETVTKLTTEPLIEI